MMDQMNIGVLSQLAEEMLKAPDKTVRDRAATRLRTMSCYDNYEALKLLLPQATSNYLRFIIGKALRYIVSNELGPQERRDMQSYVLSYLNRIREQEEALPSYVRNELYAIYAAAFYINWRLTVVTLDAGSKGIGDHIIEELTGHFPTEDVLECALVVINHIAEQESKGTLGYLRTAFVHDILPSFFQLGVGHIAEHGRTALEVCCAVLESIPSSPAEPLITVRLTTHDSVFLEDASGWFPALTVAAQSCGRALLADPTMELGGQCAQLLRVVSAIVCLDPEWFSARNALNDMFLELTGDLLTLYTSTGLTHLLQLSCTLLVNVFDRDEGKVSVYLYNRPQLIEMWAGAAQGLLDRWDDDEEEIRREVMHLFYLFGDRVIPRVVALNGQGCEDPRALPLASTLLRVGQCYFENVVSKAHLQEDSNELRSDVGVMLHNEKTLLPIAEMFFCEQIDLYSLIVERLVTTIEQYEACVELRGSGDKERLGELMLSLAINQDALPCALKETNVFLFITHVCLSRLSVIIAAVAIAMLNDTARNGDKVIDIIGQFAQGLVTATDTLTTAFLEGLSFMDMDSGDVDGASVGNVCEGDFNSDGTDWGVSNSKIHVGVLRSLFFYCGCVYESQHEGYREFYEILASLVRYVYMYHSDKAVLVSDANNLLMKILGQGVRGCFLSSGKMTSLLTAVKEDRIFLLRTTGGDFPKEERAARSGLFTALTFFVESRHYAGFPTFDLFPRIVANIIEGARQVSNSHILIGDLIAVAEGIHQPEPLYWLLDAVGESHAIFEDLLCADATIVPLLVELCARLCDLAKGLLHDDKACEAHYSLFSFATFALRAGVGSYGITETNSELFLQSPPFSQSNELLVYNMSSIMSSLIDGEWCNLGVVLVYNEEFLSRFYQFLVAVISTPVELIMSHTKRRKTVFNTITAALSSKGYFGAQIRAQLNAGNCWTLLLTYLVRCLGNTFLLEILATVDTVLNHEDDYDGSVPLIEEQTIGDIFHEVAVHVAGCPSMEESESELCFKMLTTCFEWSPSLCSARMGALLDFCSAYHRVRLRHIHTLLRSGRGDVLHSYVQVFGLTSKVQTLSAW